MPPLLTPKADPCEYRAMHPYNRRLMLEANKRRRLVVSLRSKGMTFDLIGKKLKISRQRAYKLNAAAQKAGVKAA